MWQSVNSKAVCSFEVTGKHKPSPAGATVQEVVDGSVVYHIADNISQNQSQVSRFQRAGCSTGRISIWFLNMHCTFIRKSPCGKSFSYISPSSCGRYYKTICYLIKSKGLFWLLFHLKQHLDDISRGWESRWPKTHSTDGLRSSGCVRPICLKDDQQKWMRKPWKAMMQFKHKLKKK